MAPPGHTFNSSVSIPSSTTTASVVGEGEKDLKLPGLSFRFDDLWTDDGAVGVGLLCVVVILLLMLLLIVYNIFHLCKCCHPYPNSNTTKRNGEGNLSSRRRSSKGQGSRRSSVASPPVKAFLTPPADPPAVQKTPDNQRTPSPVKNPLPPPPPPPPPSFIFGSTPSKVGF